MKKIIIAIIVLFTLGSLFLFKYELISGFKSTLTDNLIVQEVLVSRGDLKLIAESEDGILLRVPLNTGTHKFPRIYGKNFFFIESSDTIRYLDVSYYKFSVWRKADIHLEINQSGDSLLVFWKRTYADSVGSGEQVILLGRN